MQTFLPYESFIESARCLDNKRLGKQRVEAYQILRTLLGLTKGWRNHPAVRMWEGYEGAIAQYAMIMSEEWIWRGNKDTVRGKIMDAVHLANHPNMIWAFCPVPPWLGNEAFHASHRSNLLRKNPSHYGQFGWSEPDNLPYVWPIGK